MIDESDFFMFDFSFDSAPESTAEMKSEKYSNKTCIRKKAECESAMKIGPPTAHEHFAFVPYLQLQRYVKTVFLKTLYRYKFLPREHFPFERRLQIFSR